MDHQIKTILIELKELIHSQACRDKEILSLSEAALFLGISKSSLYKMTSARSLPVYKPAGKLIYFKRTELNEWLLQNRQGSMNEISNNVFIK